MVDKKERGYSKDSKKTSPSGIRFDANHLDFIQKREAKLTTKQRVVDWLLERYYQTFHVEPDIAFHKVIQRAEAPIRDVQYVAPLKLVESEESQFDLYKLEIKETGHTKELERLMVLIKKDTSIPNWQQIQLTNYAIEHSKDFF